MRPILQAGRQFAITPSDVTVFDEPVTIYVGVAGNLAVVDVYGNSVTYTECPVGWQPIQVTQVLATGTAATNIVGGTV